MAGHVQTNEVINLPDTNYDFEEADSGKIFRIPAITADRTYRLPPREEGLFFTIVNSTTDGALGHLAIIDQYEVGNNMYGVLLNTPAAVVNMDDTADVEFDALSVKGDYIQCTCDGNRWYVSGMSGVVGLGHA